MALMQQMRRKLATAMTARCGRYLPLEVPSSVSVPTSTHILLDVLQGSTNAVSRSARRDTKVERLRDGLRLDASQWLSS